jgi:hypothetical protein
MRVEVRQFIEADQLMAARGAIEFRSPGKRHPRRVLAAIVPSTNSYDAAGRVRMRTDACEYDVPTRSQPFGGTAKGIRFPVLDRSCERPSRSLVGFVAARLTPIVNMGSRLAELQIAMPIVNGCGFESLSPHQPRQNRSCNPQSPREPAWALPG